MCTVAHTHKYIYKGHMVHTQTCYTHNQTYPIAIDFLSGGIWEIFLFALWNFLIFFSINEYVLFVCFKSEKKKVAWVCIQKLPYKSSVRSLYILLINLRFTFSSSTHRVSAHEIQEHLSCTCSPSNFYISIILHIVIKHYISEYSNYLE